MGNVFSSPRKAVVPEKSEESTYEPQNLLAIEDIPRRKNEFSMDIVERFLYDLTFAEKYHLCAAGFGLVIGSLTNMLYPRIMGYLVDVSAPSRPYQTTVQIPRPPYPMNLFPGVMEVPVLPPSEAFTESLWMALPIYIVGMVASFIRTYNTEKALHLIELKYRKRIIENLMKQGFDFYGQKVSTHYVDTFEGAVAFGPCGLVWNLCDMIRYTNSTVVGMIHMYSMSPRLTVMTLATVPVVGCVFKWISTKLKTVRLEKNEQMKKIAGKVG